MGGDTRKQWIFIYFIIVYFQYFFVRINSAALCSQEGCSTNCCNCTFGSSNLVKVIPSLLCNDTCPMGFYMSSYDPDKNNCTCIHSTTTISPSVNDKNTTSLENYTTSVHLESSTTSTRLLTSTAATSERNILCQKCNDICLSCEGSATNCTRCQNGSELKEGGNCIQITTTTTVSNNSQQPLAAIIGGSVGGGVALIIGVTIIIVCCVRRQKRRNTSRMSGILQGRAEGGEKRDDDVPDSSSPHPIYENVERPNALGNQIQEHGDNMLRYARDPTMIEKKKEPKQADPTRSSSYYENSATIRRQDNIQDVDGIPGEHAELEQLGQAPMPPPVLKNKPKKSLKSRMSKKIKKLKGNVSTKASPISDQEEHYLPMGPMASKPDLPVNKEASLDNQEVYEEMEDKLHQPPTSFEQENYENIENTSGDVPSVCAPPPPMDEQEDYENIKDRFPVPARARTGQKSKDKMPDPPTGAKLSHTSPASGDDKLSKDYINVEKYRRSGPETSTKDGLTSQETQDELEDYENVKHLSKKQ